jgi:hypothetical protein
VDAALGLSVYMDVAALHAMLREGETSSGTLLLVDTGRERALAQALKRPAGRRGRGLRARCPAELPRHDGREDDATTFINVLFARLELDALHPPDTLSDGKRVAARAR